MSFLNAQEPSACDLVTDFGINILWHPSLGVELV
jgi:hydrogenase small subunit